MPHAKPILFYDFIDPLSYLLIRELDRLPGRTGRAEEHVAWHPLELRPPPTPLVTLDDSALAVRWAEARHLVDSEFEFHPPRLVPWTRKAHESVLHAGEHGSAHLMRRRIFDAYLREGADIGRVDILVALAVEVGLDRTETKAVLDVDRYQAEAARLREHALGAGAKDTPTLSRGDQRLEGFHNRDSIGTFLGT